MSARVLRPRATSSLAIVPVIVTDLTCAAALGLEPRHFRELIAKFRVPHVRAGRRVIVDVGELRDALARAAAPNEGGDDDELDDAPASVDNILRLVGRSRNGAPR